MNNGGLNCNYCQYNIRLSPTVSQHELGTALQRWTLSGRDRYRAAQISLPRFRNCLLRSFLPKKCTRQDVGNAFTQRRKHFSVDTVLRKFYSNGNCHACLDGHHSHAVRVCQECKSNPATFIILNLYLRQRRYNCYLQSSHQVQKNVKRAEKPGSICGLGQIDF